MKEATTSISNTTKGKLPSLPFESIKNAIVGKSYELSIAFVTPLQSQKYNRIYRSKDYPTNILSFALDKKSGEIIICPQIAKRDAPDFDMKYENFIGFLLIHGMLHLKGMEHGSTMEAKELLFRKKFKI